MTDANEVEPENYTGKGSPPLQNDTPVQLLASESAQVIGDEGDRYHLTNGSSQVVENNEEYQLSFERKKNTHLIHLFLHLRSSDSIDTSYVEQLPNQSDEQLEKTYKEALAEYALVCEQLEHQTSQCRKTSTELRNLLREKHDKADRIAQRFQKYREDIAQQSCYVDNKPFDMKKFEELVSTSQALDDDIERERLQNILHKVEISQIERKIKKKNTFAGGISQPEINHLADDIEKSNEKLKGCALELKRNISCKRNLLDMQSKCKIEIQRYRERNEDIEQKIKEMDKEIEKKRNHLARLESLAEETKKKIGYDAVDIGASLKSRMVNDDFLSSEKHINLLHEKLKELTTLYATLVNPT